MAEDDQTVTSRSEYVTAGSPAPEHVAFVLLGMVATIAVLIHIYLVFVG